jgi:hypothetical protein
LSDLERSRAKKLALLLLIIMVIFQPMVSFAVTFSEQHLQTSLGEQASVMDDCCPKDTSMCTSGEQCESMTLKSCLLAISLGDCGLLAVFLPVGELSQELHPESDQPSIALDSGYRSIVLDTLTPPPNSPDRLN